MLTDLQCIVVNIRVPGSPLLHNWGGNIRELHPNASQIGQHDADLIFSIQKLTLKEIEMKSTCRLIIMDFKICIKKLIAV